MRYNYKYILLLILTNLPIFVQAQNFYYKVSADVNIGSGSFSPFYFSSNNHGINSIKPNSGYLRGEIFKNIDNDQSFSWGGGIDLVTSYNNNSAFWIQQLYGEIKYHFFNLSIGNREYNGVFKNPLLSSGGLVWSGNARPIPQIRLSIPDFITIPGTKGWLQIKGDISYGLFTDKNWLENRYNYQNSFITTGVWYHQKKLFFRSKESKSFVMTIGGEFAAQFGGTQKNYQDGELNSSFKDKVRFKDFFTVLIPQGGDATRNAGDQAYYYGNHLGAWHAIAEYKFKNKSALKGYFEWLFEDGSGIGKLNGWDGLWGLEYNTNRKSIISNIVLEYLQTTNQGGPIHWAPNDFPGTEITAQATGADDYYNNYFYNGWAHYGMSNGSPLLKSPAYNKDGYLRFVDTRIKAYHVGINGFLTSEIMYLLKLSYRRGWGTPFIPIAEIRNDFSGFMQFKYEPSQLKGYEFSGRIGFDHGNIYDNNFGFGISVTKKGRLF